MLEKEDIKKNKEVRDTITELTKLSKLNALTGGELPLVWRKRISLSKNENIKKHKWYHPKCIIWWPIFQKWLFTEYKDNFLLLDYLILGDNPILNTILIKKIVNKAILTKQPITIGIVKQTDFDYWGYHYYKKEKEAFQNILAEIDKLNKMNQYSSYSNKNNSNKNLITLIQIENNFDIAYYRQFIDNKNYCFFLSDKKDHKHFIENEMPHLAQTQRKLKESLIEEIQHTHSPALVIHDYCFPKPKSYHFNYIISSKVFLTTYQKDFNYQTEKKSIQINNEWVNTTYFHHDLEHNSFGSALHHPDSFSFLEDFALLDIDKIRHAKI